MSKNSTQNDAVNLIRYHAGAQYKSSVKTGLAWLLTALSLNVAAYVAPCICNAPFRFRDQIRTFA